MNLLSEVECSLKKLRRKPKKTANQCAETDALKDKKQQGFTSNSA